ncbi:MAG: histidine phosphatase family protein [Thermoanaerobaculales bacterium]|jgi:broad specificity phosphatase PhoE|nr:histidine phosphatase family protein [Thermoanaerobaculales bacterium]
MGSDWARLVLVRHGEVEANRSYRYLGRRDDVLTDAGRRQAEALAVALSELPVDAVISSPLKRALDTAQTIAGPGGLAVELEVRLLELDFGDWDGRSRAEVVATSEGDRRRVQAWEADPTLPVPGGESLAQLQERVVNLANDLTRARSGSTLVLVSHMGPIKTLLLAALGLPLTAAARIFLDPATVSVVDWSSRPVVRLVNSHAHLGFAGARWLGEGR